MTEPTDVDPFREFGPRRISEQTRRVVLRPEGITCGAGESLAERREENPERPLGESTADFRVRCGEGYVID